MKRNYWITSDTHFGHTKLVADEYRDYGFEDDILNSIKNVIRSPQDVFIHLGDVALYEEDYWHQRLMDSIPLGVKRWLILGNHDKKTISWYLERGWDFVGESLTLSMFGVKVVFSHIPKTLHKYEDVNIHGHLHDGSYRADTVAPHHCCVHVENKPGPFNLRHLIEGHRNNKNICHHV